MRRCADSRAATSSLCPTTSIERPGQKSAVGYDTFSFHEHFLGERSPSYLKGGGVDWFGPAFILCPSIEIGSTRPKPKCLQPIVGGRWFSVAPARRSGRQPGQGTPRSRVVVGPERRRSRGPKVGGGECRYSEMSCQCSASIPATSTSARDEAPSVEIPIHLLIAATCVSARNVAVIRTGPPPRRAPRRPCGQDVRRAIRRSTVRR